MRRGSQASDRKSTVGARHRSCATGAGGAELRPDDGPALSKLHRPLSVVQALGVLLISSALAMGLATPVFAGSPACDQLRKCAAGLAEAMAAGGGWRPETIAQYRRMSTAPLDTMPNAPAVCAANLKVIANNAAEYHARGKLKRLPGACR